MELCPFGKTGMMVSRLGFGGAEIGHQCASLPTVEKILGAALDSGINVIDTAECYGLSEELIGQALSHRRSQFYLFTKCGHCCGFDEPDWSPRLLVKTIERALKRLRTDHLDLVQVHSCSEAILKKGDVVTTLERVKAAGKARFIGYSGDRDAALYAIKCGAFDALQASVNVADQEAIDRVIPLAAQKGIGVIAKRPLANAVWHAWALNTPALVTPIMSGRWLFQALRSRGVWIKLEYRKRLHDLGYNS
jgi:aryl-alcohol dehydrogenase-like predicted oxidoreductase